MKWHFAVTLSCCGNLADNSNNATIFINEEGKVKITTWKGQGGFGRNSDKIYESNIDKNKAAELKEKIESFNFSKIKLKKVYPLDIPFVTVQFPTTDKAKLWHASCDEAYGNKDFNKLVDEYVSLINKLIKDKN